MLITNRKWLISNLGKSVTIYDVTIFYKAFFKTIAIKTVQGFRATGIFSFNPNIFLNRLYAQAKTTNRNDQDTATRENISTHGSFIVNINNRNGKFFIDIKKCRN